MAWRALAALATCAATCWLSACGGDGDTGQPTSIAIETRDLGPYDVSMRAPDTVPAGPVEIELRNRGDMLHDAQLFRVDGDRKAADIVDLLESADNETKPRWLHPAGGVAPVRPNGAATVRQVLAPGVYYAVDTQERTGPDGGALINAAKDGIARIEVTGDGGGTLPDTPATIVAKEYGYDVDGIVAGTNRVTFRNAGNQFHQAVALPVASDVPYREAKLNAIHSLGDTGWVPVDVPHERATTVLEGGGEQITELTLGPGRYVLLCFVSDRVGGGAQWAIGMNSKLQVPGG